MKVFVPVEGDQTDHLEPSLREFYTRLAADYELHTAGREIDIIERRRVAELVRAPW